MTSIEPTREVPFDEAQTTSIPSSESAAHLWDELAAQSAVRQ